MRMSIGRGKGGTRGEEAFRIGHLYSKIKQAIENGEVLEVDFTDMMGLDYSFLDEAFGGFVFEEKIGGSVFNIFRPTRRLNLANTNFLLRKNP